MGLLDLEHDRETLWASDGKPRSNFEDASFFELSFKASQYVSRSKLYLWLEAGCYLFVLPLALDLSMSRNPESNSLSTLER